MQAIEGKIFAHNIERKTKTRQQTNSQSFEICPSGPKNPTLIIVTGLIRYRVLLIVYIKYLPGTHREWSIGINIAFWKRVRMVETVSSKQLATDTWTHLSSGDKRSRHKRASFKRNYRKSTGS